jgi:hypothetical protein
MVTPVIVVLDEARDLGFEITGQVIVLEQNAVLARLGCIRLTNEDIVDLYNRTPIGAKVIVFGTGKRAGQ